MDQLYTVQIEDFAERHFIKKFRKKHKENWDRTQEAVIAMHERIDNLILRKRANAIVDNGGVRIIKSEFSVYGTHVSPKSSGNRCIAACRVEERTVRILLIYHKNDLARNHETAEWKRLLADNYPEYRDLLR